MKINQFPSRLNQYLFFGLLALFLPAFTSEHAGCKSKHKDQDAQELISLPAKTVLPEAVLRKNTIEQFSNKHQHLWADLSGKTEGDKTNGLDFSGNLYWIKDSLIWMSLRKFGFEGIRVQINPHQVTIINRLDKTVLIRDVQWLESQYGLADGWPTLQALLLNQPLYLQKAKNETSIQDSLHVLTQRLDDKTLNFSFTHGDFRLQKLKIHELRRQITVSSENSHWSEPGAKAFSARQRDIFFFSPEEGNLHLNLNFNHVEFDKPRPVKFEIPEHYERI